MIQSRCPRPWRAGVAALALASLMLAPPLAAGAQAQQTGFVTLRGADTLAVERVVHTGHTIRGELRISGVAVTQSYVATTTPDHRISRFVVTVRSAGAAASAPPLQRVALTFDGDTAVLRRGSAAGVPTRVGTRRGALPFINLDWRLVELAAARARMLRGASDSTVSVPLFTLAGAHTIVLTSKPLAGDSALITLANVTLRAAFDATGHLVGATVPAQGLTIRRTGAPARGAMRPAPKNYPAPPGAPYTARPVRVPSGGHTLACTLTRPESARPVPAAVTITGSGPEDRDESLPGIAGYAIFRQIADTLSRRGIAVLRCDDRGYGESTGDFAAATSRDFANDVRAELAWLRARQGIDGHELALIGHSEGGLIAPMVAATDSSLAGIVLLAGPALPGAQILRYQALQQIEQDTVIRPAGRDSALAVAMGKTRTEARRNPWLQFFMSYDPLPTARKVHVPVLILQGGTDWQVLPAQAHQLDAAFKAGGESDVTLHVFPDHDHLFLRDPSGNPTGYASLPSKRVDGQVLGTIADWLARRLGTR